MIQERFGTTELYVQKFIMETPNKTLIEMGLEIDENGKKFNEYQIKGAGRADVVIFSEDDNISILNENQTLYRKAIKITVIEIKERKIDYEAFFQVVRYAHRLKRIHSEDNSKYIPVHIHLILLGHSSTFRKDILLVSDLINESMDLSYILNLSMYNYIIQRGEVIGFDEIISEE